MILYEHSTNIYTFIFCILVRQWKDIKRGDFVVRSTIVFPCYQCWVSSCTFIIFPKSYRLHQMTSNIKMGALGWNYKNHKTCSHFKIDRLTGNMQSYVFERKHDAQMREETVSLYNKHSTVSKINKHQKFVNKMDNRIFLRCTYLVSIKFS